MRPTRSHRQRLTMARTAGIGDKARFARILKIADAPLTAGAERVAQVRSEAAAGAIETAAGAIETAAER